MKGYGLGTKIERGERLHIPDVKLNQTEKEINPAALRTASMQKRSAEEAAVLAMIKFNMPREVAR